MKKQRGGRDETPRNDHGETSPGEDQLATKKGRRHPPDIPDEASKKEPFCQRE